MPRPHRLPDDLPEIFDVATALTLGVSRSRLRRADLRTPFYGLRAAATRIAADDLAARCREYAPRLMPWQFYSHDTALGLVGAPMPEWPYRVRLHVSAHRPAREPRTEGVLGHRLQLREAAIHVDADGLPIEHPVRAWRQAGTLWGLDDLIAAADHLVAGDAPLATVEELRHEVAIMGDVPGRLLSRAIPHIRLGVRSPRETRLRLLLVRAGLPEPEVAWVLRDRGGRRIAELDLAYPRWRVAPEYDGRVHADDHAQFAKDGDRWDAIRAAGWDHVRIMKHHMRGNGAVAVQKVRAALLRAGWSPVAARQIV